MSMNKQIVIKNIYYMLSYAFQSLRQGVFEDVEKEDFDEIQDLLAAILARGISLQLKQGLYCEYMMKNESMVTVRGKIDIHTSIKHKIARQQLLACEFDELSENNYLNQILKTTVILLLRSRKVNSKYKDILKKEILFFSNVEVIEPSLIQWSTLRFQRHNQTYRLLISICQLIIEGMIMTTQEGSYQLTSFIDEQRMSRLYEKFILEYYVKHFPTLHPRASRIQWALDDEFSTMLPNMQSDVTLNLGSHTLILDAKYYARTTQAYYNVSAIHSGNLYQMFTYVKNKQMEIEEQEHRVSGMILYAETEESIQPNQVYEMSGNKISVKTLDLNLEFFKIAEQLDQIAYSHFGSVAYDVSPY